MSSPRVARPLESGADPAAVLVLTFSGKAAQEMAGRIAAQTAGVGAAVHPSCLQIPRGHVLDPGIATHAGVVSGTNLLAWPATRFPAAAPRPQPVRK